MNRNLRYVILGVVLILLVSLVAVLSARAAVTLTYFKAYPDNPNIKVSLLWETGSDLDFSGFYILKGISDNHDLQPLTDESGTPVFIPTGGQATGSQYSYIDTVVSIGVLYYYQLKIVELDNALSYSDVVSVTLGSTQTPTVTPTPSRTPTATKPTSSATQTRTRTSTLTRTTTRTPTPTRTKTRKPTITRTRTPSPYHVVTYTSAPIPSKTPTVTPTVTYTPSNTPTATTTLIPLPSLTLLFSVHTHTPTFTPTSSPTSSPIPPTPTPTPKPDTHISLRMSFLGGIIALLWITLAGFLFVYFKRMSNA